MAESLTLCIWIVSLVLAVFAAESEPIDSRRGSIATKTKVRSIEFPRGMKEAGKGLNPAYALSCDCENNS